MIHFIIGYNNPKFKENIINNLKRLKAESFIIVQNGAIWEKQNNEIILNSKLGVCNFLNTGLNYLKSNYPNDWFARLDSDDYYGESYNDEIYYAMNNNFDFSGITNMFVKTENEQLYLCKENAPFGGTLSGSISKACFFNSEKEYGEDSIWFKEMSKNQKFYDRSPKSYSLVRYNNHKHTFPMSANSIAQTSLKAYLIGPWDEDVVNFKKEFKLKDLNINPSCLFDDIRKMQELFV
jgi:hypothetical protein